MQNKPQNISKMLKYYLICKRNRKIFQKLLKIKQNNGLEIFSLMHFSTNRIFTVPYLACAQSNLMILFFFYVPVGVEQ